ncbi:HPr family phosphocarrier protein [Salinifilum aidingensis]
MTERQVTVASEVGLHARPAALVAKAAAQQQVPITIRKEGADPVECGSILGLMALGAAHGDEVVLAAEGDGAEAALEHVAGLVASDLDTGE